MSCKCACVCHSTQENYGTEISYDAEALHTNRMFFSHTCSFWQFYFITHRDLAYLDEKNSTYILTAALRLQLNIARSLIID